MRLLILLIFTMMFVGCGGEVFYEDFDDMSTGNPGAADIGDLYTNGPVYVVNAPSSCSTATSHWLRISQGNVTTTGNVSYADALIVGRPAFSGTFTASFVLCIPPTAGDFSVDVKSFRLLYLSHLDFMSNGTLRVNDELEIGEYKHGLVTVILTVDETDVSYSVIGGGKTVNATVPHFGMPTAGFEGLRFTFPWTQMGTVYVDEVRIVEQDETS